VPSSSGARGRPRFIPTRAGTTRHVEHLCASSCGSSRRARERRTLPVCLGHEDRFIPTRAGTTRPSSRARRTPAVHPDARGNDAHGAAVEDLLVGSSRRARERRDGARRLDGGRRFIPTRAGTTQAREPRCVSTSVHPDARGNDAVRGADVRSVPGSSRRARERRRAFYRGFAGFRFIPTRAGTTRTRARMTPAVSVHPDARGNDAPTKLEQAERLGSSRRARERPRVRRALALPNRFIPTRAGTTRGARATGDPDPVHPDARGNDSSKLHNNSSVRLRMCCKRPSRT